MVTILYSIRFSDSSYFLYSELLYLIHTAKLKDMVDDLDERIAALARECPSEWSADKARIEGKLSRMKSKWKVVWGAMGDEEEEEEEYGIGGA
jgi:hypothetical protein